MAEGTYKANLGKGGSRLNRMAQYLDEIYTAINGIDDAAAVSVLDAGALYAAENVEDALAEVMTDLDAAEAAIAALDASNSFQGPAANFRVQQAEPVLSGRNPSLFNFIASSAARMIGTQAAPFAISAGETLIIDTDDGGEETVTFDAATGTFVGGTGASEDVSGGPDTKLSIAVDADVGGASFQEITLVLTGLITGAAIATQIQTQIQALGGIYAAVTCAFSTDHYVVTSGTLGTGSKVLFNVPATFSLAEQLELGAVAGAPVDGTGDVANIAAVTIQEAIDLINADTTGLTASDDGGGQIQLDSDSVGHGSSILHGTGTAVTDFGFIDTQDAFGSLGLGIEDMGDGAYQVQMSSVDETTAANIAHVSAHNRTATGFQITCETEAYEGAIACQIMGLS